MVKQDFSDKSDEELVKLTLDNQYHFAYLIQRYQSKLLGFILRISNFTIEQAEDILQEVFLKAYLNLNSFDESLKFSSWIYRIARNQTISLWRKKSSQLEHITWDIQDETLNNLMADIDLDKQIDHDLLKKTLSQSLGQINQKYKEVIILKFFEEKSYEEIADIIKKPPGTVATWINRGKKQLKQILQTYAGY